VRIKTIGGHEALPLSTVIPGHANGVNPESGDSWVDEFRFVALRAPEDGQGNHQLRTSPSHRLDFAASAPRSKKVLAVKPNMPANSAAASAGCGIVFLNRVV